MTMRYVRSSDCEAFALDGEWMIVHTEGFTVTRLNETGGCCWSLLAEPRSAEELARLIAERYGASTDETEPDVGAFLRELADCGLIRDVR